MPIAQPRIMGTETEYGMSPPVTAAGRLLIPETGDEFWCLNGAKYYMDCMIHPEYAGPEVTNAREVALYTMAGDLDVRAWALRNPRDKSYSAIKLYKDNTGWESPPRDLHPLLVNLSNRTGWGCHENYLVPRKLDLFDTLIPQLEALVATLPIITGAGHVISDESGRGTLVPGEKGHIISAVADHATTQLKVMFLTRDEPLADKDFHRRLMIVCGDTNTLYAPTFLKFGITDLVLAMIEAGELLPIALADPVYTIRSCAEDWQAKVRLESSQVATAIDIQAYYADQASAFVQRHKLKRFKPVIKLWQEVIETLRHGQPEKLVGVLDWPTRWHLVKQWQAKSGKKDYWSMLAAMRHTKMLVDRSQPDKSSIATMWKRYLPHELIREAEVRRTRPPQDTRARIRGEFLKRIRKNPNIQATIAWGDIKWLDQRTGDSADTMHFLNPYESTCSELEAALSERGL